MRLRFNPDKFLKPDRSIPTALVMIVFDSGFWDSANIYYWPTPLLDHHGLFEALKVVMGLSRFNSVPIWETVTSDFTAFFLLGSALVLFIFGLFFRYFNFLAVVFWFLFLLSIILIRVLAGSFFVTLPQISIHIGLFVAYCLFRMTEFERKKRKPSPSSTPSV